MSGFASSTPHRGLAQRGSRRSRHRLIGAALMGVMLFASAVQAEGVPPDKAKPQEVKKANKAFGEGIKLFQKGDYEKAIKVFQQAHDIVARPDASLMIARSYRELGQLVEARAQFDKAKSEAEAAGKTSKKKDEYAQTIQQIDKDIADLDGILVKLEIALVDAPEGTKVDIDGDPVNQDLSKPVLSSPGTLSITATAPDGKKVTEQIQVNAGQTTKVELNFSKPPPPKKAA
ncbi:MAG TPA: tetratricopeptide repeat protein, partial [Polyangiaceae bacterium]